MSSLKEYLKKYQSPSGGDDQSEKKKKKKKRKEKESKPSRSNTLGGVLIVDEDPTWQKPVNVEEEEERHSSDDDAVVVEEDIEVKRMRRLEELRARKPYLSVSEDGSGWVSLSKNSINASDLEFDASGSGNVDLFPPRKRNQRQFDTLEHDRRMVGDSSARRTGEDDLSPPRRGRNQDLSPPRKCSQRRFDTPSPEPDGRIRDGYPPRHSGEGDLSPPRKRSQRHFDTPSPKRSDFSPRRTGEDDLSPPRRGGNQDLSPPRKRNQRRVDTPRRPGDKDTSLPHKRRHNSPHSDLSPPRQKKSDDLSPPWKHSHGHTETLSPKRGGRMRDGSSAHREEVKDLSPLRKRRRDSSDVEMSWRSSREVDLSPPRRKKLDDLSPPRKHGSPYNAGAKDLSPPRRSRNDSPDIMTTHRCSRKVDLSPPRKKNSHDLSPARRGRISSPEIKGQRGLSPEMSSKTKLASIEVEKKGGLFSRGEIKEVIDKKKADDISRLAALDPFQSGKGAEPVYRIQGKRVSKEEKLKLEKKEEKPKEIKIEWGKGLSQKREAEAREKELELESERPFARTRDDPELEKMLKERVRWGDPMAHLVKNNQSDILLEDFGNNEKMKESGFIIPQNIPNHSWIKRKLDPPPNRYNIKPGRHWDGVDRSSGYEKELFKRQNEKKATQTEAYLWSVSDM